MADEDNRKFDMDDALDSRTEIKGRSEGRMAQEPDPAYYEEIDVDGDKASAMEFDDDADPARRLDEDD